MRSQATSLNKDLVGIKITSGLVFGKKDTEYRMPCRVHQLPVNCFFSGHGIGRRIGVEGREGSWDLGPAALHHRP